MPRSDGYPLHKGMVGQELHLKLPAVAESVPMARHVVSDYGSELGVDPSRLRLAVSEAVTNVIDHAYPEDSPGEIVISAERQPRELVVRVVDAGVGIRPEARRQGLSMGLPLMASVSDRLEIDSSGGGTSVTMAFPVDA